MQFYRISETDCAVTPANRYEAKQADAHAYAKTLSTAKWNDVRIELVDVRVDQLGICQLLNHADDEKDHKVLKTWKLTQRGGLADCANGE